MPKTRFASVPGNPHLFTCDQAECKGKMFSKDMLEGHHLFHETGDPRWEGCKSD